MVEKCGKCNNEVNQPNKAFKCVERNGSFHQRCIPLVTGDKVSTRNSRRCDSCAVENQSYNGWWRWDGTVIGSCVGSHSSPEKGARGKWYQNIFYKLNEVQEDLKKVTSNITSINTQFEEVKTQNKQTCESVTEIKEECAHLRDWVLAMSAEINDLQQRTRKN